MKKVIEEISKILKKAKVSDTYIHIITIYIDHFLQLDIKDKNGH